MTHEIIYSPFYYFDTKTIYPTEEHFSTIEEALDYLRKYYRNNTIIAKGEDWMGVTRDLIDIDDNGDTLGGEVLERVVVPIGRFWWINTDNDGNEIIIFKRENS